jgi:hypothetical protein
MSGRIADSTPGPPILQLRRPLGNIYRQNKERVWVAVLLPYNAALVSQNTLGFERAGNSRSKQHFR